MRWGAAFALLWWGVSPHLAFGQARADREQPLVLVGEYDGIIHPIAAEFVDDLVSRADREAAVASVLVLRTPGGLLDSTRTIVSRIIAARAPVVVYVGPSGARAASAGFLVTIAADDFVEAIAWARLVLPPEVHVQAPPNLSDDFGPLLDAGIDDWGGVSPVTADHVNPERPWPALDRLRPDIWTKGGDYEDAELPEAGLVRSWGGRVVLLPYLSGRSSTAVLHAIHRGDHS